MHALSLPSFRRLARMSLLAAVALSGVGAASAVAEPLAVSVSPSAGPSGTVVTVSGTDLAEVAQAAVTGEVDGVTKVLGVQSAPATAVKLQMPVRQAGGAIIRLYANQTLVTSAEPLRFTYASLPAPIVTSLSPTFGPIAGGTAMYINGTNLSGISSVTFGGVEADDVQQSGDTLAVAFVPPHPAGPVDVTITTPSGSVTKVGGYTYIDESLPALPKVTRVSPNTGFAGIGGLTQLTGSGFTGVKSVRIGGRAAGFLRLNSTTISVVAPAQAKGTYPVTVTTTAGTSVVTAASRYTYLGF